MSFVIKSIIFILSLFNFSSQIYGESYSTIPEYQYKEVNYEIVQTPEEINRFFTNQRDVYEPEEGETIFIIARHGENESNVAKTYDGRTLNLPLTPKGHIQGEEAGRKISKKVAHVDHVITTSMCRTQQTAIEILKAFPLSQPGVNVDERFLERYMGKYEGGTQLAMEPSNKEDKRVSASLEFSFEYKMKFKPEEDLESYAEIWERVYEGMQENALELKNKVVLVVSHSSTIRSIYWHLTQKLGFFVPYENFRPENGAYMIVSVKDGDINLLETGDFQFIPISN